MNFRCLFVAMALLTAGITTASATVRISDDRGGRIGTYINTFEHLRHSGESVVIDGPCLSACTLIVGLLPPQQVCVTRRAALGFHAAWKPDPEGRRVTSIAGTRVLMRVYPPKIRRWIRHQGGLTRHMIFLRGRALASFYPRCH